MRRLFSLFLLLALCGLASSQELTPDDIRAGGYVLYFRHAQADIGTDCKNPEIEHWWLSREPEKTRQLTKYGKLQAQALHRGFAKFGIKADKVFCSEFRRTQETAKLMHLGRVHTSRLLTPLVYKQDLKAGIESFLAQAPQKGAVTVLVAHGHVLPWFEDLHEGDAAVFAPGQPPVMKGIIRFQAWKELSMALKFEGKREEDRYLYRDSTVTVLSSMGIGSVVITPEGEHWPPLTKVRFEYADGRGMPVLEGLHIKAGDKVWNDPKIATIESGARVWTVPAEALSGSQQLEIQWIDFYR